MVPLRGLFIFGGGDEKYAVVGLRAGAEKPKKRPPSEEVQGVKKKGQLWLMRGGQILRGKKGRVKCFGQSGRKCRSRRGSPQRKKKRRTKPAQGKGRSRRQKEKENRDTTTTEEEREESVELRRLDATHCKEEKMVDYTCPTVIKEVPPEKGEPKPGTARKFEEKQILPFF